ncbi:MAG: MOP flippase family protein [Gammaproteobacteria bacterium]
MLKQRALSATLWSGADILLRQGLQFVITIVLAHLLSPSEFGTIALLVLFTGIATVFVDGGFSAALIQRQDVNHNDESTVFWFNLCIGAVVALGLWAAAPAIARFYAQPILVPLMVVLALNVFLGALGAIHATLLTKRLDFRTQMKIGVVATLVSGSIAIWMAWKGYGVWSLAAQAIGMTTVTTTLLWLFNHWYPNLSFSRASARKLFGFGGYHLGSSLLEIIYVRLYTVLVGRFYGVRELGFYNNADNTKQLPAGFLTNVLSRVAFPMFSEAAEDKVKLRRGMQLAVRGTMLLNAPMMLGMAAVAEPLVRTLFGAQWLAAVPILRVLCLAGLLWPLHVLNLNVLMAQGHSRLMFRLEVTKKVIGVVLLCVGALYGVLGIAWSQVVFSVMAFTINAYYTWRFLDYGIGAQLRDFWALLCIAAVMSAIVYLASVAWHATPAVELIGLVVLGAVIFLTTVWLLRLAAVQDVVTLFRRMPTNPLDRAKSA